MSNETPKTNDKKPAIEKLERIPLSKKSSKVVATSISKMLEKYPTVRLSKKDMVNWIIEENFGGLSLSTEKILFERFQDEIKFLEKSIQDLKDQRRNGNEISLQSLLKDLKPKFRKSEVSSTKKNTTKTEEKPKPSPESEL